jgi:DNA-binding NtrC family response regulator
VGYGWRVADDRRTGTWLTYEAGRAVDLQVRRCHLSVLSGVDAGRTVEVETTLMRVGARQSCDLALTDQRVSGYHFEIQLDEIGYRLRDLDSSNGTYVSGLRVREAYLEPGMVIQVGDSRIRFEPLKTSARVELSARTQFGALLGQGPQMRSLFAQLERVAPTEASVLVQGETGVGKELVAEAIHRASPRASGPFVVVDCGSIAANLISSELFGHEKGAFTGATSTRVGAFERASGGTLFLDELGELPMDLQPSLLGALERRRIRRVGGKRDIPIDIRIVAATHRDLPRAINKGRFREDLYYRLAVVKTKVPPLRERLEDVPMLVTHFLEQMPGGDRVRLKQRTIDNLCRHDYPGNVRELRNLIERAVIMSDSGNTQTMAASLPSTPAPAADAPASANKNLLQVLVDTTVPYKRAKGDMVEEFEKRYLSKLIKEHDGNVSAAARATGLDRMTVHKMLQKHGISTR